MSIISFNIETPMLQGVVPRTVQLVSTDSLATITTAGYMNKQGQVLTGMNLAPTDVVNVIYNYSTSTNTGTFGIFTVSFSAGVITLTEWANPGDVLLPVVSGDYAIFNGTSGQIKDSSQASTNAANPFVVSSPGAVTSGNLVKFGDANGSVANQGVAFKSVAGATAAGGSAAQSFTDAFCTTGSCVVGNWNTQTNPEAMLKIVPGNGSFVVTSAGDVGAGTFNYIITK